MGTTSLAYKRCLEICVGKDPEASSERSTAIIGDAGRLSDPPHPCPASGKDGLMSGGVGSRLGPGGSTTPLAADSPLLPEQLLADEDQLA